MPESVLGVIPARFASRRFEGKPLEKLGDKLLVQHVYERCMECALLGRVVVATDDDRILNAVRRFGGDGVMTSSAHLSGTDRVAEVAAADAAAIVVNIQGDEPFVNARVLEQVVRPLLETASPPMSTLCKRIETDDVLRDPNVVKVVRDSGGHALYFSRTGAGDTSRGSTSESTPTVASSGWTSVGCLRPGSKRSRAWNS